MVGCFILMIFLTRILSLCICLTFVLFLSSILIGCTLAYTIVQAVCLIHLMSPAISLKSGQNPFRSFLQLLLRYLMEQIPLLSSFEISGQTSPLPVMTLLTYKYFQPNSSILSRHPNFYGAFCFSCLLWCTVRGER